MEYTETEVKLAHKIHSLQGVIENLQGEIALRDARIMKLKGEIFTLKSLVGHQNIYINTLTTKEENIVDTTYEEDN